jgi:hypothetical protein
MEDLEVHCFDGHVATRPFIMFRGRECGQSRLTVNMTTLPQDWHFRNVLSLKVNGVPSTEAQAISILCATPLGVISIVVTGIRSKQEYEFHFNISSEEDLNSVDAELVELIRGRSLSINSIEAFLRRAEPFQSARPYMDAFANYFYGVLSREGSSESGLVSNSDIPAYVAKYDDAVEVLSKFDRPLSEGVCGLVAFHYNQFDTSLRRTRSPRVARVSLRLASLFAGIVPVTSYLGTADRGSWDYVLSDTKIEKVLSWCCIPLDGSAHGTVEEIEAAQK